MRALLFAALLLTQTAHAELTAAVGLGKQVLEHKPFERAVSVGYRINIAKQWFVQPQAGGWTGGQGLPSWFIAAPVGLQVWIPNTGAYATAAVGPSRISQPDNLLGGHWQFCPQFSLGLKTELANIGVTWMHFSSAGLIQPNQGRDFIGIQMGVEL